MIYKEQLPQAGILRPRPRKVAPATTLQEGWGPRQAWVSNHFLIVAAKAASSSGRAPGRWRAGQGPLLGSLRPCSSLDTGWGATDGPWAPDGLMELPSCRASVPFSPFGQGSFRHTQRPGGAEAGRLPKPQAAPTFATSPNPSAQHLSPEIPGRG